MPLLSKIYKNKKNLLATVLVFMVSSAYSEKNGIQITQQVLSKINTPNQTIRNIEETALNSDPNSFVELDFSVNSAESWDIKDQSINFVTNCFNGDSITGFEYTNVTIETLPTSYFSEAIIYFTDSSNSDDGINLTIGAFAQESGTRSFSSDGILDITDDTGENDVISLSDKKFLMQFYEVVDDSRNQVDARFTNGKLKIYGQNLIANDSCEFIAGIGGLNADLSTNISNTQELTDVDDEIVYQITIQNNSANVATNVVLENTISDNLSFSLFSCNDGTEVTDVSNLDSVNVSNLAANDSLNCTLDAIATDSGSAGVQTTVNSNNDNNSSNNSASGTVIISGTLSVQSVPATNLFTLILLVFSLLFFTKKFRKFNFQDK